MRIPDGSSVLIVLMGSIGDVARGLVLVHQLRSQVKNVRITWLVEPKSRELAALHPGIDELLLFNRGGGVRALFELRKMLAARKFDVTLDLQRIFKSGFFSRLSGAKRRVGFHRGDAKEFNYLFASETIPQRGESIPKLDHYLVFVEQLGLSIVEPLDFGIRAAALARPVPSELSAAPRKLFGLVLGSAWRSKDWIDSGYDELIKLVLARTDAHIVLLGDRSKSALAEKLLSANPDGRVLSVTGKTSLADLAGVLARLTAACGPDSGPGHIAAAVGTPYTALFGPTDPVRTAPFGSEEFAVHSSIGCAPCYRRKCPGLDRLCMRLISPAAVFDKLAASAQR